MNRLSSVPFLLIRCIMIVFIAIALVFVGAGAVSTAQYRFFTPLFTHWSRQFSTSEWVDAMGWENPYISENIRHSLPSISSIALRLATNVNPGNIRSLLENELPGLSFLAEAEQNQYPNLVSESAAPLQGMSQKGKHTHQKSQGLQSVKNPQTVNPGPVKAPVPGSGYYIVRNHTLWHDVSDGAFIYGAAPGFLSAGEQYFSGDGHTFYNSSGQKIGTAYQYFEILPLNTKTSYTADQLNRYIRNHIPETYKKKMDGFGPLATLGSAFIHAQDKFGVNALYLLAHAIHESAWGSSQIAQDKHNLFGFGAVDSNPYGGAMIFDTYKDCIDDVAQYVAQQYQNPTGAYYYGDMLGNKETGMNVKYASDPFWGQEIAGQMYQIDKALGGKDFGKYDSGSYHLAVSTVNGALNVRTLPSTAIHDVKYQFETNGDSMIVLGKVNKSNGTWYQIYSDESNFLNWKKAYVYHKGQLGLFCKIANVAGIK